MIGGVWSHDILGTTNYRFAKYVGGKCGQLAAGCHSWLLPHSQLFAALSLLYYS